MELKNIKQAAQNIRLSHDEKAVMRAKLFETIDAAKYAPAARPVRMVASYSWFSVRFAAPVAAVLVVVLGGTTVYAAQGALPGGALYPVKIYVNEGLSGALAVSDEARLSFHTTAAQERLKEAEALAAQGRLNEEATVQIETNFDAHVAQADELAQAIEDKDPSAGVEAKITLDSSISAHQSILARIGEESKNAATQENSTSLAMRVGSRDTYQRHIAVAAKNEAPAPASASAKMQTMAFSASLQDEATTSTTANTATSLASGTESGRAAAPASKAETQISSTSSASSSPSASSTTQKKTALQLQKKAVSELAQARHAFARAQDMLDATTTDKTQAQFSYLEEQSQEGDNQIEAGDYDAARDSFAEVLHGSLELQALIEASAKFNTDFIQSLRGGWGGHNDNDEQDEDDGHNTDNGENDSFVPHGSVPNIPF
jgi:hypothetical protein